VLICTIGEKDNELSYYRTIGEGWGGNVTVGFGGPFLYTRVDL